ncbi:polysaccharide biosynthesis tyrosine autokinase [Telmatospirillum sp.]|uniref:polysaccharide biosynthesis tyrosine autokinase n=1 Tax=Telmatospirillum sp. TaxID=2079197 RepID=UPI0028404392|nr:polysaccharide biosynthesis tyrosine autokinase [Telmatospirillum sp.]MDR3435451.1 polysaccharide biosynthesis tyrosine autokinase [Telmatospirillum sp.]
MLERLRNPGLSDAEGADDRFERQSAPEFDYEKLVAAARRQLKIVALAVVVAVTLGVAYLMTAQPLYTASTRIIIDSRRNQDQLSTSIADATYDTGAIDSQVEVLKSDNVAEGVVKALKLDGDPEFISGRTSIVSTIFGLVRSAFDYRRWMTSADVLEAEAQAKAKRAAISILQANLDIKRVGKTYVLSIDYTSPNADRAVAISHAYAEAYYADQLNAKFDETRRASGWLQDRILELKQHALTSDMAVQRFLAKNGLIMSADGSFYADQQMKEITTQVSDAHAATANAEARLRQINDIIAAGRADAAVTESLGNPVITDLRQKYLKASKSASELSAKLGLNHYQVISLKNEMSQYERLIFDELHRIAESTASDLEVARGREKSLNQSMASLVGQKAVSDEVMVQLRELQREAETYKTLYQTFLQRYQDAVQKQSFPSSEARTISEASRPTSPSSPKSGLVLALSAVLGLLIGGGLGAFREYRDRVFRSGQQVKDELGLALIGMLQSVKSEALTYGGDNFDVRQLAPMESILRYAVDHPLSSFAETLRGAKVEADLMLRHKQGCKILGVVSVLPGEGKSTIAKNFASMIALQGAKTLLIDGDLRNPGLTRQTARVPSYGLLEVLRGEARLEDALLHEADTGLLVLPTVIRKRLTQSSEILSSLQMEHLLQALARSFDYVVVDLPPLGPVIDVRAAGRLFDGFLFVVEWGKTTRNVVKTTFNDDAVLYEKCFGVVLNKVEKDKLDLYQSEDAKGYYYRKYGNYYIEGKQTPPIRPRLGELKPK